MERTPRVLVVDPIAGEALAALRRTCDVVIELRPSPARLVRLAADADVIVLRSGVELTAEVIVAARSLKLIARAGVGVDNIDLDAARATGVQVFNIPSQAGNAVAELAIGLMLSSGRRICAADARLRAGSADKASLSGVELRDRTLGVVGLGAIGGRVAELGRAFGMRVVACVARPSPARRVRLEAAGIELIELEQLLGESDFVCLALPLTSATRMLIGPAQLERMKPASHLVNVSRAGVVDEAALVDALQSGGIAGAATDVLADEAAAPALADLEQLVMTPHIGAMTSATQRRIGELLVSSILAGLSGASIASRVC